MNDTCSRRRFLERACALAAASAMPVRLFGAAEALGEPDLRIGVLSDIHVRLEPGETTSPSAARFRRALEYFRDRHVDGVLVAGDLADAGLESELRAVAEAWFSVFPNGRLPDGSPVANLMHYGDHDAETRFYGEKLKRRYAQAGVPLPRSLSQGELRKTLWEELFREPWAPTMVRRVKGHDFVLGNFMRERPGVTQDLDAILRKLDPDPARPFFYSQHRWLRGTYCADERMWGGDAKVNGPVLARHANCIAFTGHTHYMIADDRSVWIDRYINVNAGSLKNQAVGRCRANGVSIPWEPDDPGHDSQMPGVKGDDVHAGMVMSVRGWNVVLERREMDTGRPLGPDLVFSADPALRAENADAARKARSVAPNQPDPATVAVCERQGFDRRRRPSEQVVVTFAQAHSDATHPRPYDYVVTAVDAAGAVVAEQCVYSSGASGPEEQDVKPVDCIFAKRELAAAKGAVRYVVRARNCWGV